MKVRLVLISVIAMALFAVAIYGASARSGDPHESGASVSWGASKRGPNRLNGAIPRPPIPNPCVRHKLMAIRALRNANLNVRWVLGHCRPNPRERALLLSVLRMNNSAIRKLQLAIRMEHILPPTKRPPTK